MADADVPIKYMDRTRHYYRALGYTGDYIWATFDDVPFSQLAKPLSESRIALVTTASPLDFDGVSVWSGHVSPPPPKLFTDNVAWDKESTTKRPSQFSPDRGCCGVGIRRFVRWLDGAFPRRAYRIQPAQNTYRRRARNPCTSSRRWGGRRSSMSPLSCLPSDCQLGRSSPRSERDSYCYYRIGAGRCRALRVQGSISRTFRLGTPAVIRASLTCSARSYVKR